LSFEFQRFLAFFSTFITAMAVRSATERDTDGANWLEEGPDGPLEAALKFLGVPNVTSAPFTVSGAVVTLNHGLGTYAPLVDSPSDNGVRARRGLTALGQPHGRRRVR
jgi:hypothetical protein